MRELISRKTRRAFGDYVSTWSTLYQIKAHFDDFDVSLGALREGETYNGERRTLFHQYCAGLDWTSKTDVARGLQAFESILSAPVAPEPIGYDGLQKERRDRLVALLEADDFVFDKGRLVAQYSSPDAVAGLMLLDSDDLRLHLARINKSVDDDPEAAIGAAKELVESACKMILDDRGVSYAKNADLPTLVKVCGKSLRLTPSDINDAAKGAMIIKRLLSNLGAVTSGLAELRNLYGTGHGRGRSKRGLGVRHARLAVGMAAALTTFLFETHAERGG